VAPRGDGIGRAVRGRAMVYRRFQAFDHTITVTSSDGDELRRQMTHEAVVQSSAEPCVTLV